MELSPASKNVIKLVDAAIDSSELGLKIAEDGKVNGDDIAAMVTDAPHIVKGWMGVDYKALPSNFREMGAEQKNEVAKHVASRLTGLVKLQIVELVEAVIEAAHANYKLYKSVMNLRAVNTAGLEKKAIEA
jgi:hypothetical protein